MNIKQAEQLSGVSKRNIRYYEQEGLITPSRNPENDYREYSPDDIETLKQIRILRSVDMPMEQIRELLHGKATLKTAAVIQKERLIAKTKELEAAIAFCEEFAALESLSALNTDAVLRRMEEPEVKKDLFNQWIDDFKKYYRSKMKKIISFVPDDVISDPADLTLELFRYADNNQLNMVITKEGWQPEMTINGYEYRAEVRCIYFRGIPSTLIRCIALHPEEFDPEDLPEERRKWIRILLKSIPYLFVLLIFRPFWDQWAAWVAIASIFFTICIMQKYGWPSIRYQKTGSHSFRRKK